MKKKAEQSFEKKLNRLSVIVDKVENTALPLEEAMKLYEEGNALIKELQNSLEEAEAKIKVIKEINIK